MAEINEVMNVPTMYDRDLVLQGLFPVKREEEELTEECGGIELSLGLSLNGKFGVDPRAKKLMRSSSVATFGDNNEADAAAATFSPPVACGTLARTCSLPVETEEEVRRRKELQTLRRMEAKRKRDEKQRNLRAARENWEESSVVKLGNGNQQNSKVPAELSPPRGSIASQGSGSSGISEPGSPPVQGSSKQSGIPRHPSALSLLHQNEQQQVLGAAAAGDEPPVIEKGTKTSPAAGNTTLNMPYVSTKGDGPNGKRVEGFLYQYRKGEEVRIVCVCHGSFLSPADFVKHAGGEDVEYPLKHILVNPSSFL